MNTYTLYRDILHDNQLSSTEKLVGLAVSFHISRETGCTRLKVSTLAGECGVSGRTVIRCVSKLVGRGYFVRQRTGRATILCVCKGSEQGNVEVPPVSHLMCHPCHIGNETEYPMDTIYSTPAEEKAKKIDRRFKRMEARERDEV